MTRPLRVFGDYLLLRRLEQGALSELWRAARLESERLGATVALRRFHGGDLPAIRRAAQAARGIVGQIEGTTIVREQIIDVAEGSPFIVHAYPGGRSLRAIADRARSGHAVPTDQALGIAERLTASVQMLQGMKLQDRRLVHGALVPQFVWISEEGEVRVAGQQLAPGIVASLADSAVREEIAGFLAPEVRSGGEPSPQADVYSIGATLFLLLTGEEPPAAQDAMAIRLREARLAFDDEKVPADVGAILEQSLAADPARRFASSEALHQALTKLIAGGYAPTTFNLAFYLHTLLKDEMEEEAKERAEEMQLDPAPFVAQRNEAARVTETMPAAPAARPAPRLDSPPPVLSQPERKRSRAPLAIAATVLLVAGAAAAYLVTQRRPEPPVARAQTTTADAVKVTEDGPFGGEAPPPAPQLTAVAPAEDDEGETAAATSSADEEARRRAFEAEVDRRLREEVARLQAEYEKQLAAERARAMKAAEAARTPEETTPAPAATATTAAVRPDPDQLNQKTLDQIRSGPPAPVPSETATAAPAKTEPPAPAVAQQPPPSAPVEPVVREGDLVDLAELDRPPTLTQKATPEYPPIARKRRISGSVILTVLINERGEVADVRILRGDPTKIGFDDAAVKAARQMRFTPPMKDGKRVKTWLAIPVNFQLAE